MWSYFFNDNECRLSPREELYFSQIMIELHKLAPSDCWVKFMGCLGVVIGCIIGTIIGSLPGFVIGGLAGFGLGISVAVGEYLRLLKAFNSLSQGEKIRLVYVVQRMVGGSSDIRQVEKVMKNGGSKKLLEAVKQNPNTEIV